MKLRNKETGEIHEITQAVFLSDDMNKKFAIYSKSEGHNYAYRTLEELNEEWEDYEEPKEYWFVSEHQGVYSAYDYDNLISSQREEIGNYFETREDAEKAVEKLKAWKRLKDNGFRFDNFVRDAIYFNLDEEQIQNKSILKDLDLLFGGEK